MRTPTIRSSASLARDPSGCLAGDGSSMSPLRELPRFLLHLRKGDAVSDGSPGRIVLRRVVFLPDRSPVSAFVSSSRPVWNRRVYHRISKGQPSFSIIFSWCFWSGFRGVEGQPIDPGRRLKRFRGGRRLGGRSPGRPRRGCRRGGGRAGCRGVGDCRRDCGRGRGRDRPG